jgi:hypothetical protein
MACVNHPDVPEVTRCDNCRRMVCADCFVMIEGRKLCGRCKAEAVRRVERGGRLETGRRSPSPWEQEKSLASLVETTRQVLVTPRDFYSGLALEGSGFWSYVFAIGWPSTAVAGIIGVFLPSLAIGRNPLTGLTGAGAAGTLGVLAAVVLLAPLQLAIGIAIQAGILHLFLRMVGGASGRLETTVRAIGYGQAVFAFNWIPLIGPVVGGIWLLVLMVVGLREMHGTSTGRALAAILLPFVLCFGSLFVVFGMALLTRLAR